MLARVGGIETGLVSQQDQQVSIDQGGNQCREIVVVAHADFLGGNGIVFIDDGDDALFEERGESVACIDKTLAVLHVGTRQQNLADAHLVDGKKVFPHAHQLQLADGSKQLLADNRRRQLREIEMSTPGSDGP